MSVKTNYFKIGLFVIGATALGLGGLLAFGIGAVFKQGARLETFVDESVQGLEVGSPVKYRGVKIGSVEKITFLFDPKNSDAPVQDLLTKGRYVRIIMKLDPGYLASPSSIINRRLFEQMIEEGLRVRLTPQGITGIVFLSLDYLSDPQRTPKLEIDWEPEYIYIPSAPSAINVLFQSFDAVYQRIEKIDIEGIADNLNELFAKLNDGLESETVKSIVDRADDLLAELGKTNSAALAFLSDSTLDGAPANLAAAVEHLRAVAEKIDAQFDDTLRAFKAAADGIGHRLLRVDAVDVLLPRRRLGRGLLGRSCGGLVHGGQ